MHFVLQTPSLQHLAGVKIIATSWNQPGILEEIDQAFQGLPVCRLRDDENKWKVIEKKVKSKVSTLPLPEPCKWDLLHLIKPIGMEIVAWCCYISEGENQFRFIYILTCNQLRWTMHGVIDYAKTAELMVEDHRRLSVERRFEIACLHCLEDQILQLFPSIPEERRRQYLNRVENGSFTLDQNFLIIYFIGALTGRQFYYRYQFGGEIIIINAIKLFEVLLPSGNRATCQYFYQKLTPEEKARVLLICEMCVDPEIDYTTCSLMYGLSLLNEEQQASMFRRNAYALLAFLMRWPMQALFVEAAQRAWQFITDRVDRTQLMNNVIVKISDGFTDYDYGQLFRVCWRLSPAEDKQRFLSDTFYLGCLIATKKEEFVKLVLNRAPAVEILVICNRNVKSRQLLMCERVISDAALMECKAKAASKSFNQPQDVEKRLRSVFLNRLVAMVMENRKKRRDAACFNRKEFFLADFFNIFD